MCHGRAWRGHPRLPLQPRENRVSSHRETALNILNRSFTITANVDVPADGGNGIIVTEGGRWGGYGLYLLKGKPVFTYNALMLLSGRWANNAAPPLAPG
jgi:hypothetical protein